jgi:hypothetical protein
MQTSINSQTAYCSESWSLGGIVQAEECSWTSGKVSRFGAEPVRQRHLENRACLDTRRRSSSHQLATKGSVDKLFCVSQPMLSWSEDAAYKAMGKERSVINCARDWARFAKSCKGTN